MLEVVEVCRVDSAAGCKYVEMSRVKHLHAHIQEGASGDHVELEVPQRPAAAAAHEVPDEEAEPGRVEGEARHGRPHVPGAHGQEQRSRQKVPLERPHQRRCSPALLRICARLASGVDFYPRRPLAHVLARGTSTLPERTDQRPSVSVVRWQHARVSLTKVKPKPNLDEADEREDDRSEEHTSELQSR